MHVLNLKIKITRYTTRGVRALGRVLSVPSYPPLAFLAGFEPSSVPAELSVSGKIPPSVSLGEVLKRLRGWMGSVTAVTPLLRRNQVQLLVQSLRGVSLRHA